MAFREIDPRHHKFWQAKAGQPARTYIQQLCAYTGCSLENLPEAMDNRKEWHERVIEIHAVAHDDDDDDDCYVSLTIQLNISHLFTHS